MNTPTVNITPAVTVQAITNTLAAANSVLGITAPMKPRCHGHGAREHATPCGAGYMLFDPVGQPARVTSMCAAEPVDSPSKQPKHLFNTYFPNMSIFDNILKLFPLDNDSSLLNITRFPDHIVVYFREVINATSVQFNVDLDCANNLCTCNFAMVMGCVNMPHLVQPVACYLTL